MQSAAAQQTLQIHCNHIAGHLNANKGIAFCNVEKGGTCSWVVTHLAIYEQLEQGNGLLCTILIHARHIEIIQEYHELLAHWRPISILGPLLSPILQFMTDKVGPNRGKEVYLKQQHELGATRR